MVTRDPETNSKSPYKLMVGTLHSYWEGLFSEAFAVSFREGNFFCEKTHTFLVTGVLQGLGEFESNQNALRDGGSGIPPVIRNRFDIFRQWDKVQQKTDICKVQS